MYCRDHARTIDSKSQLFISAYAKALEIIPRQLCDNAGFDATDVLNALRQKHAADGQEGKNYGVDINTGATGCCSEPGPSSQHCVGHLILYRPHLFAPQYAERSIPRHCHGAQPTIVKSRELLRAPRRLNMRRKRTSDSQQP